MTDLTWTEWVKLRAYKSHPLGSVDSISLDLAEEMAEECDFFRQALREIADTPIPCLNPDGVDQAAEQMRLIASEALHR